MKALSIFFFFFVLSLKSTCLSCFTLLIARSTFRNSRSKKHTQYSAWVWDRLHRHLCCFIIFGGSVETMWVSCFLACIIIIILVMALTPRHSPPFTHCPWNTLLRKLLPRASLDLGRSRWIPRGLIACLLWGSGGVWEYRQASVFLYLATVKNAINK